MAAPTTPRRRRNVQVAASSALHQQSLATHHHHHPKGMGFWKIGSVLGLGLAFHLVYMLSIFDIYFKSPLVHGVEPIQRSAAAPAKRLVLFVGDGCRADKAFELKSDGQPRAPFLHSIAKTVGSFGVCHTRVPTESRPGHIAMIAGFYEDVSAVTKGWKANPVDYDHLLARAKYAWAFGAPEIVDLFSGPQVIGQHYASEMIDFAACDAKQLDKWSFERLRELFEAASVDEELAGKLKSDQVVLFVHLLGLDTNGHAHKPHSREYLENVEYVDAQIKEAVAMIDAFFSDSKTAYIYTADHGMSDAGTHGDGDPDNTRTPFVGWGAGLSGPQPVDLGLRDDHDDYSSGWGLSAWRRRDFNQADMTPLMATLVGIPIPVNSEGVLPIKVLSGTMISKSLFLLDNVKQLAATYTAKETQRRAREPFFVPPPNFSAFSLPTRIDDLAKMIRDAKYADAQRLSFQFIKDCLGALSYLHKYDAWLLKGICTAGYLGWIVYAIVVIIGHFSLPHAQHQPEKHSVAVTTLFTAVGLGLGLYLMAKRSPLQFFVYAIFPLTFWHEVFQKRSTLFKIMGFPFQNLKKSFAILTYVAGLELLVASFFFRPMLIAINGLVALSAARKFDKKRTWLSIAWLVLCLAMSFFPLLPPIKDKDTRLYLGGVAACLVVSSVGYGLMRSRGMKFLQFFGRSGLICLSAYISLNSDSLLRAKSGLPAFNQNVAWIVLAFSVIAPMVISRRRQPGGASPGTRLLDLFMTFAPAYILLSVAYEPLFYAFFGAQLAVWVALESSSETKQLTPMVVLDHLWVAYGFLFFINMAFFGTGNMASVSSFTLDSVYRLITVFSPFAMATLLILKLLIPFCLLSAAFGVLSMLSGAPPAGLLLLVVGTTDVMTLNFFYLVRDHGSWLEIGTSISQFVIASGLIVFTLVLFGLSHLFLAGVHYGHAPVADIQRQSIADDDEHKL